MNRLLNLIVTLLTFTITITAMAATNASAQQMKKYRSEAGYSYWHYAMKDAKRTAVAISWKTGLPSTSHPSTARIGINLMLNGGAGGKSPDEIIADFQDLDAGSRLWAQPGEITGFIVSPNDSMHEASGIANLVLTKPTMDEKWFAREKKKTVDRSTARESNVHGIAWTLIRDITVGEHPYRDYWSSKSAEQIQGITLEQTKQWHKRSFGTQDITIVSAGSADFAAVGHAIDRALSGLPKSANQKETHFDGLSVKAGTIVFHDPEAPKSAVYVLGKLPPTTDGNDAQLNVATGVLGYGQQSRLFKAIRSELRAAYTFRSAMDDFTRHHRLFWMTGEVETELLQKALDTTRDTYEEFRADGIGFLEFPFARRFYRQRIESEMAKPESVAFMMLQNRLSGLPANKFDDLIKRINNLDRGEVNTMIAKTYPPFDQMLKVIVTPDKDAIKDACVISKIDDWKSCF